MPFAPHFTYTNSMVRHIGLIESARAVVDVLPLPPDRALWLRQAARQRATRNSTRIEGNTLNRTQVEQAVLSFGKTQTEMQQEVRNYWRALEWIEEQIEVRRPFSEDFICELHSIVLVRGHGRRGTKTTYRVEECPVVDSASRTIDYAPPKPGDVPELMRGLVSWLRSEAATELPGPVRAGLLAHRFVTIHPFMDGNGRTARALATAELWRGGYEMKGFLSLEEYYTADLQAYYDSLQMGLPVHYYGGRNDPDHTPWLEYFLASMAQAAESLRARAVALYNPVERPIQLWEGLHRVQQQLLTRLMTRGINSTSEEWNFTPTEVVEWFGVSCATAKEWLDKWRDDRFVEPVKPEAKRIRHYRLTEAWAKLVQGAASSAMHTTG